MASSPADTETLRSRPHSIKEVNVTEAKGIFNHLARELSRKSSLTAEGKDVEKGKNEDDVFDLREYLTSSNDANQKAGIKHKHVRYTCLAKRIDLFTPVQHQVGVTWENLEVSVLGGTGFKVS